MLRTKWTQTVLGMLALASVIVVGPQHSFAQVSGSPENSGPTTSVNSPTRWETAAQMHRGPLTKDRGTLVIDRSGVAFQSRGERTQRWTFLDIHSFVLAPHRLIVQTYKPRSWHRPGEEKYEFELTEAVPPGVAAVLANGLRRPSQNAVPDPQSPAIAAIAVRHRKLGGGTNGILRFRNDGIDYVTDTPGDSRSWRWADLQTLSDPDPYRLLVFGYRDTYTFDLKEPLPRTVFAQAANSISALTVTDSVDTPAIAAPSTTKNIPVGADEGSSNN